MVISIQSAGVTPELNMWITQARKHVIEGSSMAFKLRANVQTEVSVSTRKGLMFSKIFFLKK